jgi:hypothetical protein
LGGAKQVELVEVRLGKVVEADLNKYVLPAWPPKEPYKTLHCVKYVVDTMTVDMSEAWLPDFSWYGVPKREKYTK